MTLSPFWRKLVGFNESWQFPPYNYVINTIPNREIGQVHLPVSETKPIMKTYIILFAVLLMGFYATAQKFQKVGKNPEFHKYTEQQESRSLGEIKRKIGKRDIDLVRLYKYKNSRIKRALSFMTPRNKAKLA